MKRAMIPKNMIGGFLDALKASYKVVAPVRKDSLLEFKEIESSSQVEFSSELPYKSPKEFFFPQNELFLKYDEKGEPKAVTDTQKVVIFGVRPCDLYSLKVLTAIFTQGNYKDPLFCRRRDNTVVIGLGCEGEKPGCFCTDMGVDRQFSQDCDVFLSDCKDYYKADILTQAGRVLFDEYLPELERSESEPKSEQHEDNAKDCLLKIDAQENELFDKIDWESISETCLGCGVCTYVCPTCHCFDFKDVTEKGEAKRYRCWDSCMYSKFTLHASGHNPRPTKKERYRQRVLHKYLYIKENFGLVACSGCGRCIRSCPAGMNIRSVVKGITEELN